LSSIAGAQSGGVAGAYTQWGSAARAIAAGNSWVAYAQEGAYIDYNPAFAAYHRNKSEINLGSALLQFDRQLHLLQAVTPLPPKAGLGILLRTARVTDFDERSLSGYPLGSFNSTELQALTSFGIRVTSDLTLGAGFKINYARFHPEVTPSTSIGIDLGMHHNISDRLQWGLTVQDLLGSYRFNTDALYGGQPVQTEPDQFPLRVQAGSALHILDSLVVTASVEWQRQKRQQINYVVNTGPGGTRLNREQSDSFSSYWQARLGASYPLHPLLTIRAGWQVLDLSKISYQDTRKISAGLSIQPPLDNLNASIDYAIVREPSNVGLAHVIAIQIYL
jgi:hypothetical protein